MLERSPDRFSAVRWWSNYSP